MVRLYHLFVLAAKRDNRAWMDNISNIDCNTMEEQSDISCPEIAQLNIRGRILRRKMIVTGCDTWIDPLAAKQFTRLLYSGLAEALHNAEALHKEKYILNMSALIMALWGRTGKLYPREKLS